VLYIQTDRKANRTREKRRKRQDISTISTDKGGTIDTHLQKKVHKTLQVLKQVDMRGRLCDRGRLEGHDLLIQKLF
jgi:hypothetical protein